MVARYGMDAHLGGVSYEAEKHSFLGGNAPAYFERRYSEATAEALDAAVRNLLQNVSEQALDILTNNRDVLETAAKRLLEVETLDEIELQALTVGLRSAAPNK